MVGTVSWNLYQSRLFSNFHRGLRWRLGLNVTKFDLHNDWVDWEASISLSIKKIVWKLCHYDLLTPKKYQIFCFICRYLLQDKFMYFSFTFHNFHTVHNLEARNPLFTVEIDLGFPFMFSRLLQLFRAIYLGFVSPRIFRVENRERCNNKIWSINKTFKFSVSQIRDPSWKIISEFGQI